MLAFVISFFFTTFGNEFSPLRESNGIDEVVKYAFNQVGKGYSQAQCTGRAGECCRLGPNCFDCSGLVYKAYSQIGKKVPSTTSGYPSSGIKTVSLSSVKAGDILYRSGHVGLVGNNGQAVHAANSKKGVVSMSVSDFIKYNNITAAYRP
ncbi:uncharacterized protein MONOS_5128 [Monocercomonoides exilis]|uniref:uncharacterized protein n=1 Tax=Monocercomonoides exilis TaxID=2049356 RepID=UPI00355A7301|nr:hypothetical protein MONOS_5128 [Monocercomonoides exilis]|eukprot:MONOS_5128.1-p1 / transcript=MONOS_5128.1 / gene=MONOS_5128 / organism=Monocercomonoides_exilis_PA203 / gene_product=unspecified product / transcript_product=unspecified product / location=Mono_scaffold00146:15225-15674(-) / protein_length=149 / sequence_SO=supercontig / SO=protein_coding / is_pseudo=false